MTIPQKYRDDETGVHNVDVQLLALDLTTCTRCLGTLANIEEAVRIVGEALDVTGTRVSLDKVIVESAEHARELGFISSPTVRVNGHEIVFDTLESQCDSCTDLCGCEEGTACRVWRYQGQDYTEAPVGLLVEALMRHMVALPAPVTDTRDIHKEVPKNLQDFFANRVSTTTTSTSCCSREEQQTCCEPGQKATCCGTVDAASSPSCGCR